MPSTPGLHFSQKCGLTRLDRALYTAKNRGRNRVEFWGDELMIQAAPAGHVSLRDH